MNKMHININPVALDKLKEHFNPYLVNLNNDNAFFHAVRNNSRITAYSNGSIEINGTGATAIYNDINYFINDISYDAIGLTCEGLNDIFGPIVFCSCFISKDIVKILEKFELNLNKKLTDYQIKQIAPHLIKLVENNVLIIEAKKYNQMIEKNIKKDQILAHCAYEILSKQTPNKSLIIVDSFVDSANFFSYTQNKKNITNDFAFYEDATQSHISNYISRIIARYVFIQKINEYSQVAGTFLIKGNTEFSKNQYLELTAKLDTQIFTIAKRSI